MPSYTNWFVTVVLEVAGKQERVQGPTRPTEDEAKADLKNLQDQLGSGDWVNLDWISANPTSVAAAVVDSSSVGFW
jgi:hypothetical protein